MSDRFRGIVPCMFDADLKPTLLSLEGGGWDSLCDGSGGDFYGDLMTDDAVMVLANGAVMDRATVIQSLEQAPPWRTYAISDARVITTGSDSAALVYLATAWRDGDEPAFVSIMSSVYCRQDDAWRLALYQQTPLPDNG